MEIGKKLKGARSQAVPITGRALIQRINRVLIKEDEQLRTTRGERWRYSLGDYYTVNFNRNFITGKHVDPEALGREMGVLRKFERVEWGEG